MFERTQIQRVYDRLNAASDSISPQSNKRTSKNSPALPYLHRRFGRRTRLAAIILLTLCIVLLGISYKYRNIVLEIDSVIAFIAGLLLLFKDQRHLVQLRVLNNIIESSNEFIESAGLSEKISGEKYHYVPLGKNVSDVVLYSTKQLTALNDLEKKDEVKGLVPPGRGLATLFVREMSIEHPTVDDFLRLLPTIVVDRLDLAGDARVTAGDDFLEVLLHQPTLSEKSDVNTGETASILCITCSLLATVASITSRKVITVEQCQRNEELDTFTMRMHIGEDFPEPEENNQQQNV